MELPPYLLCTILLAFSSSYIHPATSKLHNNLTDLESLIAFKSLVTDPNNILATSWTSNTSFCNWFGVQCGHRHARVTAIKLENLSLHGTISPNIANLSFLSELSLRNNSLTGAIPDAFGRLPRLTSFILASNFLSGPIPYSLFNISSLIRLGVWRNNLSGSLPSNNSFALSSRLEAISLRRNNFRGDIQYFFQFQNLQSLQLDDNNFSGTVPVEISRLSNLSYLSLGGNQLTGTIPASLGNLTNLIEIDLSINRLTGIIPGELGNLVRLQWLALNNNSLVGSMPTSLLNNSLLTFLDIGGNRLSGYVPTGIGNSLPLLNWFHVAANGLTGDIKFLSSLSNCRNLDTLQISDNRLKGQLPDNIGNFSASLRVFNAYNNRISGTIPSALGNLSGLIYLQLSGNDLFGEIPSSLSELQSLQLMDLDSNSLNGSVPFEFGRMKSLNALALNTNSLFGAIPESLANISGLQYLLLNQNNLSSSIPSKLWTLESLLQLNLAANSLHGSLPFQVGNMHSLVKMDLSMNQLSGNIPSLGKLQMLQYLDISHNSFQGQIPESFSGLISITNLNLSHNLLSGVIPKSLNNLRYLNFIDLSFNSLEGQIPKGRNFDNSNTTFLVGNDKLCGAPQFYLPPCDSKISKNKPERKLRLIIYILPSLSVVILVLLCLVYVFCLRKKQTEMVDTSINPLKNHRTFSYYELIRATDNFSEDNLLGRGGFGSVFKGLLDDGLTIAVKVLNLDIEGASKSFDAECQVLRTVRHKNLTKIIGVCTNFEFKAFVLEYMPNGNLENWLHSDDNYLNLTQRLNVMLDAAVALEYLHHLHPEVVLHCDLKPTNILLDDELIAHISDFGISKLLLGGNQSRATTSMPGTIGYIAPEYATTWAVSRMSDVYSFGIIMLETFTGKRPVDDEFREESSLRKWICNSYPNAILDILDVKLLNNHAKELTKVHQCLSSVIELGLQCSRNLPKERIPMTDVVRILQKINMEYLSP